MCCTRDQSVRASICDCTATAFAGCFLESTILPFHNLVNHHIGILAYKVINGTYLQDDVLTDRLHLHDYQLRNDENLRIPLHSTTQSQLFICYRAIKPWNSLPDDLGSSSSLTSLPDDLGNASSLTSFSDDLGSASSLTSFRIKFKKLLHQK